MSAVAEPWATETDCPQCGSRFAPDQEWCLECGAAVRVRIRPAPDWRPPLAIVAGVVALVAVGFVIALVALSNTANRSVAGTPASSPAAPAATATTQAPAATTQEPAGTTQETTPTTATTPLTPTTTLAKWPTGVTGYTVVLGVITSKATATTSATKIAATGIPTGLLYSSDYSSMHPGHWIVFSGTYTTRAHADAAAAQIKTKGQPGAYAFSVVPAG